MNRKNHVTFKTNLGKIIKRHRILQDMEAADMASKADINYNYYLDIEKGRHNPSIKMLCMIAAALDIPLWELVKEAEEDAGTESDTETADDSESEQ